MDEQTLITEIWDILKEYIKEKQPAADHFISHLADIGIDEQMLKELTGHDKYIDHALEYAGLDEDSLELDFDEDDYE